MKNGVNVPFVGRKIVYPLSVVDNISAVRLDESADNPQGGRFSAAAGTEYSYKLFFADIEVNIIEYDLAVKTDKNIL